MEAINIETGQEFQAGEKTPHGHTIREVFTEQNGKTMVRVHRNGIELQETGVIGEAARSVYILGFSEGIKTVLEGVSGTPRIISQDNVEYSAISLPAISSGLDSLKTRVASRVCSLVPDRNSISENFKYHLSKIPFIL